jgi:predicted enzyme related to lactoylglutathione lyase
MQPDNAINWFEIPVADFDRAKKFYEIIFGYQMHDSMMGPKRMGFFVYDFKAGKIGGAIVYEPGAYSPRDNGALIYFNCQPNLQPVLERVEGAGGKILTGKTIISEQIGFHAIVLDTEGNRIALHSMG